MAGKFVPPSVELSAFSCAHCGTFTTQYWYNGGARTIGDNGTPAVWTVRRLAEFEASDTSKPWRDDADFWDALRRLTTGEPYLDGESKSFEPIANVSVSRCFECSRLSIWLHDAMIWPMRGEAPEPNADLPADIAADFLEAGTVLSASPRAAAALLRLCIQKLCAHLGEKGRSIDEDIASLVSKGLDQRVQRALDIVRVVGNEAVHPGTMDLSDDRATAEELFRLVNLIAEFTISQPKHIAEMYQSLPPEKLAAIEKRDAATRQKAIGTNVVKPVVDKP